MVEFNIEEVRKETEEIFKEIKEGNWEKFVRLQLDGAMKKQVGEKPRSEKIIALKSAIINMLVENEFVKERGETEKTICIVTATKDFSSLINDGGYLEKPVHKEYGFLSKEYAWTYYLDQKRIRGELGLDCSRLKIYREDEIT